MQKPKIHFIGCGKVGQTLARLFQRTQAVDISGIVNRSFSSSQAVANTLDTAQAFETMNSLPPADIYFITTPDDTISSISSELVKTNSFQNNSIIVHCSGALSSAILKHPSSKNYYSMSIHPIKSFSTVKNAVETFKNTLCAIEGDQFAIDKVSTLFHLIGGNVFSVKAENKSLYHAACAIANNYLTTLHAQAYQCFIAAGLDNFLAKAATSQLMQDAINNLENNDHAAALTGPIKRGDKQTVQSHLDALHHFPKIKELYTLLASLTAALSSLR